MSHCSLKVGRIDPGWLQWRSHKHRGTKFGLHALAEVVDADEVDHFDNKVLNELWRQHFRVAATFQKATRETLLSVLEPELVGYLKPDAGALGIVARRAGQG